MWNICVSKFVWLGIIALNPYENVQMTGSPVAKIDDIDDSTKKSISVLITLRQSWYQSVKVKRLIFSEICQLVLSSSMNVMYAGSLM